MFPSTKIMAGPYEIRTGGEGKSKKQSMAELKLRRLTELNARLKEDLERRRIPVSEAALDLIAFTDKEPKDFMVPSRWGAVPKNEDPYAPQQSGGCCIVM
ncbi:G-protein complex gamma subunit Ste18/GpgA [Lineolata rhizophorae]|uniref:Guanine nucleotide-binding protein subunit gamma n=1 Tax=Lineolata rhizophorae TaxID=578093 RepID=A0A6A6PDD9_9PEZI|nr:G-protein complex gamma subunit Ste18/GpgA [Lineolata rhizophorae]